MAHPTAADILARDNTLVVLRTAPAGPELFVVIDADGVAAFNGHVDLGTGIRTALAQIVAEELDVDLRRVRMELGTIGLGPDQGATIASMTLQVTAIPLRAAAAQARAALVALAAEEFGVAAATLVVEDGVIGATDNRFTSYAALLQGRRLHITLDETAPVKPVESYRVVGQPAPRVDLPAKATGGLVFVQDMRVPGMLHGRVVRPPYAGIDHGPMIGKSLVGIDRSSIAGIPGIVDVVVVGDFIGIVAEREENAARAAARLAVTWRPGPRLPDLTDIPTALRSNKGRRRALLDRGDVDAAFAGAAETFARSYVWPYQMHASIGPSCSLADWQDGRLTVWSGTQNPHLLRADLAQLMDIAEADVAVHRMETSGCYGRNCADDVGADAALLARAVGRPVRVQLTREQEHAWEPKGAAQLIDVRGALDGEGNPVAYEFTTHYPSNRAPTLALILTGIISNIPAVGDVGDRTAVPPYELGAMRIAVMDMPPIVRAAWLRGVSALPNTFAHESFIDELAIAAGVDPVEYRLRYLQDPRAIDVLKQTVAEAGWTPRTAARMRQDSEGILHGQGVAYAVYVHSKFPGFGAAWSAWVADVAVDPRTGAVEIERITAGQDTGLMINPDGVRHQLHGNVVQSISRVLKEEVRFDETSVTSREWGAYPLLTFPELPAIRTVLIPRPNEPAMGAGESAAVPSAAAIANAIFDATGVRFREVPFTAERIKAGLEHFPTRLNRKSDEKCPSSLFCEHLYPTGDPIRPDDALARPALAPPAAKRPSRWRTLLAGAFWGAALATIAASILPFGRAIDPVTRPDAALYSAATIARGRQLAAIGNCITCHTARGGIAYAGGYRLETPFGIITTPNITPDETTGIGAWSYQAFARAMRQGLHRDGSLLYPAFPYTAFARVSEPDMEALYAFLMSAPAVIAPRTPNELRFPFNLRPLLAGWNALFHHTREFQADPAKSAAWNRGAYLVEGLGHCGGCHTPRNALGASRSSAPLAGGLADHWEAPALNGRSTSPLPWTEQDFFDYLRTGVSRFHGAAAGPMGPVITQLAGAPDTDIRAMAIYLASLAPASTTPQEILAAHLESITSPAAADSAGARLYEGACASCHQPGRGTALFGSRPSLALNTAIHGDAPDTVLRVILDGVESPALPDLGAMPAFRHSLDNTQIAELAGYLRRQFAPGKAAWQNLPAAVGRLRNELQ